MNAICRIVHFKSASALIFALLLGLMASSARAATHCVTFASQAPGNQVPFVTEGVGLSLLPWSNTIGFYACGGMQSAGATVINPGLTCGSITTAPPHLIIDSALVNFNMSQYALQLGGNPVRKLSFPYVIIQPNVEIMVNGQCVVNNNFTGIPTLTGSKKIGGVKYKATPCVVKLKSGNGPPITSFAVGGGVIRIDDVCAKD